MKMDHCIVGIIYGERETHRFISDLKLLVHKKRLFPLGIPIGIKGVIDAEAGT